MSQAILPGLRYCDPSLSLKINLLVCESRATQRSRLIIRPIKCGNVSFSDVFANSSNRPCRVSKRGGVSEQQLPDVEFEESVDPKVEV
jgi:hypothetical protein